MKKVSVFFIIILVFCSCGDYKIIDPQIETGIVSFTEEAMISDKNDINENLETSSISKAISDFEREDFSISEKYISVPDKANLPYYDSLFPVYVNGGFEYISSNGDVVTDFSFDRAYDFMDNVAVVVKDEKYGVIDLTGTLILPCGFTKLGGFNCGLSSIKNENGIIGFINKSGDFVIDYKYKYACNFSEGIALVSISGDIQSDVEYINNKGEVVLKFDNYVYDSGGASNGIIRIYCSFYDLGGNYLFDDWFFRREIYGKAPENFSEELAVYHVVKEKYRDSDKFSIDDWMEIFWDNTNWEYVYRDKTNKQAFESSFDYAESFHDGMAIAEKNGRRGCIDKSGEFVFYNDNVYGNYSEGYVPFSVREKHLNKIKHGFLDKNGNVALLPIYDEIVKNFINGLALVGLDGKLAYINYNDQTVFEFDEPDI